MERLTEYLLDESPLLSHVQGTYSPRENEQSNVRKKFVHFTIHWLVHPLSDHCLLPKRADQTRRKPER